MSNPYRLLALGALGIALAPAAEGTVPAGFTDTRVARVDRPVSIAATPDGRVLVTVQTGQLRVIRNGGLLPAPAIDLGARLCANIERGLLGVEPSPTFAADRLIYLYYTFDRFGGCLTGNANPTPVNRLSRFRLDDSDVIDPASEVVLVDNIPSIGGNHNGGDIHFGPDGYLYIAVGDAGDASNAPRLDVLSGKILRVDRDGLPAPSNPFAALGRRCGDPAGRPPGANPCAEVFAWGLRNPFRFSFHPVTGTMHINDVGAAAWEEIDIGTAGANYGWPTKEGPCEVAAPARCVTVPGLTDPIFAYDHAGGCASITGSAVVPAGLWPPPYDSSYLFADWGCGRIFRLVDDGAGSYRSADFATALGAASVVSMAFLDDGTGPALWYTKTIGTGTGDVRKIAWTPGANQAPEAAFSATPDIGPPPLLVDFDASASRDPEGDPLTYDWDFGDGNQASGLTLPVTSHTYTAAGVFQAELIVRDDHANASPPLRARIDVGNTAPVPVITFPAPATRFAVARTVLLQGRATDAEDGPLADASLSWQAFFHHVPESLPANRHAHPFLAPTSGNNLPLTPPAPEDFDATALSYLEIQLSATDSLGRSTTISQAFEPNRVALSFATVPSGLTVEVNGTFPATPVTLTSWEAWGFPVAAPLQLDATLQGWAFTSWSDGGGRRHPIVTPASALTYTATFAPYPDPAGPANLLRNDRIAALDQAHLVMPGVFAAAPADPSLVVFGPDRRAGEGEGVLRAGNGSADDDDFYVLGMGTAWIETEAALLGDATRPLVFYQTDAPRTLVVLKLTGQLGIMLR